PPARQGDRDDPRRRQPPRQGGRHLLRKAGGRGPLGGGGRDFLPAPRRPPVPRRGCGGRSCGRAQGAQGAALLTGRLAAITFFKLKTIALKSAVLSIAFRRG